MPKRNRTTIQISEEVREQLAKIAAQLQEKNGHKKSYEDAIKFLIGGLSAGERADLKEQEIAMPRKKETSKNQTPKT